MPPIYTIDVTPEIIMIVVLTVMVLWVLLK